MPITFYLQDEVKFDLSQQLLANAEARDSEKLTRELQLQHEKEVGGLTKLLKQAEKDINQGQLEVTHYKTMCTELAE